ncbi:dolichyl-phosphate-mannose--protein mannosyltransferase [Galbitalea soli]|uniref:Polyprenol-phosphate-mannose--protein mannosyltransferase n=1 Tax=Galbitalea soli TaxID=1268042 RepID=A0A7C9TQ68_9MICO|nr:phospholipid carrier-dependent glycosyltransferase [Galbitalea soli]NEM90779.1 phospholipid carrier-dependent glycosyltransferase [Galbitalea soli]NYJ31497.1 dolichyl-phosphate-mannose--protein O-mannosyl transferase [Galbitalea soli]
METAPTVTVPPDTTLSDRLWERFASTPRRARIIRWAGPVLVVLLAAGTRLWRLGTPSTLVFDETFYVRDAYTMSKLGYEGSWPAGDFKGFDTFTRAAEFVVHPPLGKWLISLGMQLFGAQNTFSWRISTAVAGILAVVLLMLITQYLLRSVLVTTIAGLLFAIDGNAIVLSRVGLLDNFVMLFGLLGFGAILLDREWSAVRLAAWIERRDARGRSIDWGPALWWRPWLLAAGLAFGLTTAVKWSGIYFLAGLAVYTVLVDLAARRRAGIPLWLGGTIVKQGPVSFLLMVPIAVAAYLASYTGWFVTKGGWDRVWADQPGNAWTGALAWVPHVLQSFVHNEWEQYNFNINEHQSHPYQANPFSWLLMIRPTSMYFRGSQHLQNGCTVNFCGESITNIANPLIWWGAVAAAVYLLYRLAITREWRIGLILSGIAVGYLPWLLYANRTVFQFYTIAFEPYLILCLAYVAWLAMGRTDAPAWRRARGERFVAVFLVVAIGVSVFFWPLWTGIQVDFTYIRAHYWLSTWL